MTGIPHGLLTANGLPSRLIGTGTWKILKSTLWTLMEAIHKGSLKIAMLTVGLHGLTHLFWSLPQVKNLQRGGGSNSLTDNHYY